MAGITKRTRNRKEYYYLYQESKKNGRKQYDKYLGTKIPENIEEIQGEFEREIYLKDWESELRKIYENYSAEKKHLTDEEKKKRDQKFSLSLTTTPKKLRVRNSQERKPLIL